MDVKLAYGKGEISIKLPPDLQVDVVEPKLVQGLDDQPGAISNVLRNPIGLGRLRDTLSPSDTVAIVFSDITRATPYHMILPALLEELAHLPDENISLFCALGTHRPATEDELVTILGRKILGKYRLVQNDSGDLSCHNFAGTTTSGNRVMLHHEVLEADLRILTGFIEPHFFAGFSGGGKALMPGMAHENTIRFNHSISHLEDPGARWGLTDGNPLWEEVMEAAEFAEPIFLLNVTLNRNKEITGVFAGDIRKAHEAGCRFARESAMAPLDEPYDIVLSSNSGHPLDLNVYQSVKGMSAAERIVKQGGSIILAAECWDGIPANSDYETILASVKSSSELMEFIRANEHSLKDTWQVYFQAMIQQKANVYLYSALEDELVRKCLLHPVKNIGELVRKLVSKLKGKVRICVLPLGPWTIPYITEKHLKHGPED